MVTKGLYIIPSKTTCMRFFIVFYVLLCNCVYSSNSDIVSSRVITTKYGKIQGLLRHNSRPSLRPIELYLGVPYASAPVRQGRFTPTSSPLPWDHIRKCDKLRAACPQPLWDDNNADASSISPELAQYFKWHRPILQNQNEDCLYLNIYAPHDGGGNYPVFVYIHGGSFSWGSGNLYDGSTLSSYGQMVVVIVNYRLGPLGFLNTSPEGKTSGVVSNQGIMDQLAAVTWVKENIAAFGGNSDKITLAGHSTGAVCIGYLLASPVVVPGQFHKVILMSGSPFSPWSEVPDALSVTVRLAKLVGCNVPSDLNRRHPETMACLRNVSADDLVNAPMPKYKFASVFGPSVDGIVISKNFKERLRRTIATRNITLLFGISERDAFVELNAKQAKSGFDMSERNKIFRTFVRNTYRHHLQEIYLSISKEYTNWANPSHHPLEVRDLTVAAISDGAYLAPLIRFADLVSSRSKSYMYVFTHYNRESTSLSYLSEVSLLFGRPFEDQLEYNSHSSQSAMPLIASSTNFSRSDALVSEYLMRYFVNFVKTGNPNLPDEIVPLFTTNQRFFSSNTTWEQYDPIFEKYMDICTRPRLNNHYRAHKVALWNWLLPELEETGSKYPDTKSERWHKSDDQKYFIGPVRPLDPFRFMRPTPSVHIMSQQPQAESSLDSYLTPNVSAAQGSSSRKDNISNDSPHNSPSLLDYTTALTLTVAIGLSLLVLNVILFGALLYKREKNNVNQKMKYDSISSQPLCTLDSGMHSTPTVSEVASTDKEVRISCSPSDSYNTLLQTFPNSTDIGDINNELQCKGSPKSILTSPTSQFIPPPPLLSTTPPSTPYLSIKDDEDCTNFDKIHYITDLIPHSSSYHNNPYKPGESMQNLPEVKNKQVNIKLSSTANTPQVIENQVIQNHCVCSCDQGCESPGQYSTQQCTQIQCELKLDAISGSQYNDNIQSLAAPDSNKYSKQTLLNRSYSGGKSNTLRLGQITALNTRYNSENRGPKKGQMEISRSASSFATLPRQEPRVFKNINS